MKLSTGQCDDEEVKDLLSDRQLTQLVEKHDFLKSRIDELSVELSTVKEKMKDDLIESKKEKGVKLREVGNPDKRFRVLLVEPQSLVFDEKALVDLLKSKKLWTRCQKVVVDKKTVEEVVREGKVTVGEMDKVSELKDGTPYVKVSPVKGGK